MVTMIVILYGIGAKERVTKESRFMIKEHACKKNFLFFLLLSDRISL